jgi:hypothetical protein
MARCRRQRSCQHWMVLLRWWSVDGSRWSWRGLFSSLRFLEDVKLTPSSGSWATHSHSSSSVHSVLSGSDTVLRFSHSTTHIARTQSQVCRTALALNLSASTWVSVSFPLPQNRSMTRLLTTLTAYFMIAMGILCLIYLICSIRTNLIFFLIFFSLVPAFGLLAAAFLHAAKGNAGIAGKCQEAAGAFTFVTCMCGWYILLAIMLASVDFPFDLPRKFYSVLRWKCLLILISCSCRLVGHRQGRKREAQDRSR